MDFFQLKAAPIELDKEIAKAVLAAGYSSENPSSRPRTINDCTSCNESCACNQPSFPRAQSMAYPLVINVVNSTSVPAKNRSFVLRRSPNQVMNVRVVEDLISKNPPSSSRGVASFSNMETQEPVILQKKQRTLEYPRPTAPLSEDPVQEILDFYVKLKKTDHEKFATNSSEGNREAKSEPVQERKAVNFLESAESADNFKEITEISRGPLKSEIYMVNNNMMATPIDARKRFSILRRKKRCDENGCHLEDQYGTS